MDLSPKLVVGLVTGTYAVIQAARHWYLNARKSRLLRPSTFEIPTMPGPMAIFSAKEAAYDQFLLGRTAEITSLTHIIQDRSLIFVEGPSGVGKSTLLKLGVARQLIRSGIWLPIYVDTWGTDWRMGPLRSLTAAVQVALDLGMDQKKRKDLGISRVVTEKNVFGILERLRHDGGLRPVLIFDQLDDYQIIHSHKLSNQKDGSLISVNQLTKTNTFWRHLQRLIRSGVVHSVLVVRDDCSYVLEVFRFDEPVIYRISTLPSSTVRTLVNKLAGPSAVTNPENGFYDLVEQLKDDLEESSEETGILPIQMRVVLTGLTSLDRLTPADLRKAGGVAGLEAGYLQQRIRRAPFDNSIIPVLLRTFVRSQDAGGSKTVSRTLPELAESMCSPTHIIESVLDYLESEAVLRRRHEPGRGEVWQLYHDYLARAVLSLADRDQRWQLYLAEQSEIFTQARWLNKLTALAPPARLLRLAYERLRGRLRFRKHRFFIICSTPRLLLNIWFVLTLSLVLAIVTFRITENGKMLTRSFEAETRGLSPEEVEALWNLSIASPRIRKVALANFLQSPLNARRFVEHKENILVALSGVNDEVRHDLIDDVIRPHCYDPFPGETELIEACTYLIHHLDYDRQRVSHFVHFLSSEAPPSSARWSTLFIDQASPDMLHTAFERIWKATKNVQDEKVLAELYDSGRILALRLGPESALRAAEEYLEVLKEKFDDENISPNAHHADPGPDMHQVALALEPMQADSLAVRLLEALESPISLRNQRAPNAAIYSLEILSVLAHRLEPEQARSLLFRLEALRQKLEHFSNLNDIRLIIGMDQLSVAQLRLAVQAKGTFAREAVRSTVKELEIHPQIVLSYSGAQLPLCDKLIELRDQLPPASVDQQIAHIKASIERVGGRAYFGYDSFNFAKTMRCIGENVDSSLLRWAATILLSELHSAPPGETILYERPGMRLASISNSLGLLADQVTPDEASLLVNDLLRATREGLSYPAGLPELAARLEPTEARSLVEKILHLLRDIEGSAEESAKRRVLSRSLAGAARSVGADSTLFRQLIDQTRGLTSPPCGAIALLASKEETEALYELLRWPTCDREDRLTLLNQLSLLAGGDPNRFEYHREQGAGFGHGYWEFLAWFSENMRILNHTGSDF